MYCKIYAILIIVLIISSVDTFAEDCDWDENRGYTGTQCGKMKFEDGVAAKDISEAEAQGIEVSDLAKNPTDAKKLWTKLSPDQKAEIYQDHFDSFSDMFSDEMADVGIDIGKLPAGTSFDDYTSTLALGQLQIGMRSYAAN